MKQDTNLLTLENLRKSYADQSLFSQLNLTVENGQWLGVIGSNGSGKTTLAKIIMGIEAVSEGNIYLAGKKKEEYSRKEWIQDIQLITQYSRNSLDPSKRVKQLLLEPLRRVRKLGKKEGMLEIHQMLRSCQLSEEILTKRPTELSGGQYQRVCIALALVVHPKVLICDEITASLDRMTELQIIQLLKRRTEMTVLFISHNQKLLNQVCDRMIDLEAYR